MENNNVIVTTLTIKIFKDNELIKEFNNQTGDFEAFKYLQRCQPQSVDWALRTGYKVEETNEQTNEVTYWKPYANGATY